MDSMTNTDELAAWLLEQIDADEQRAQAIPENARVWNHDQPGVNFGPPDASTEPALLDLGGADGSAVQVSGPEVDDDQTTVSPAEADHIAAWDPARVLAECDAKRQLVEAHAELGHSPCDAHDASLRSESCEVLRLLALPYTDRPGYRAEWSPTS
jgi:hypothetical protein